MTSIYITTTIPYVNARPHLGFRELVDANAAAFTGLAEPLALSVDDLIRTSSDPRHRAGVERLWRACAASGDL